MITLYDYHRSSACFRVRIALELKGLDYNIETIHLINNGGEQHSEQYALLNPQKLIPTLVVNNHILTQSMAILEFLEDSYPNSPLLPKDKYEKAKVRSFYNTIACDIHPLNNLRVQQYITGPLNQNEDTKLKWYHHWLHEGFLSLEKTAARSEGTFCFGEEITLAEVALIPQLYNAFRFKCDMANYPHLVRIYEQCMEQAAFIKAAP